MKYLVIHTHTLNNTISFCAVFQKLQQAIGYQLVTAHMPLKASKCPFKKKNNLNLIRLQRAAYCSLWWVIKRKHITCVKWSPHLARGLIAAANHSQMVPIGQVSGCLARRGVMFDPPAALAGELSWGKTGSAPGCTQRKRSNLTEGLVVHSGKKQAQQSGFSCGLAGSHPVSLTRPSHATGIVIGGVNTYKYSTIYNLLIYSCAGGEEQVSCAYARRELKNAI